MFARAAHHHTGRGKLAELAELPLRSHWMKATNSKHPGRPWHGHSGMLQAIVVVFCYFFMTIVVIRYETKTAARGALTFIVRIFVNDTIAITVWTSFYFHACSCSPLARTDRAIQGSHEPDGLYRHNAFTQAPALNR